METKLSRAANELIEAIKKIRPDLPDEDIVIVAATLLELMSKKLRSGENLAFVRHLPDGRAELTIFDLEEIGVKETESKPEDKE